jgi:hypothetical protein
VQAHKLLIAFTDLEPCDPAERRRSNCLATLNYSWAKLCLIVKPWKRFAASVTHYET